MACRLQVQLAAPWPDWKAMGISDDQAGRLLVAAAAAPALPPPLESLPIRPGTLGPPDATLLSAESCDTPAQPNVPCVALPRYCAAIFERNEFCWSLMVMVVVVGVVVRLLLVLLLAVTLVAVRMLATMLQAFALSYVALSDAVLGTNVAGAKYAYKIQPRPNQTAGLPRHVGGQPAPGEDAQQAEGFTVSWWFLLAAGFSSGGWAELWAGFCPFAASYSLWPAFHLRGERPSADL